jgi:PHD/YefM family antitoxin component YafN of YafNO toxin-antitoxin module
LSSIHNELVKNTRFNMVAARYTQSLTDFREKATETLDRLDRTGEAEVLTVNGKARAILLSPEAYESMLRELEISQDVATIRQAVAEGERGEGQEVNAFFDEMRAELLAMKDAQAKGSAK